MNHHSHTDTSSSIMNILGPIFGVIGFCLHQVGFNIRFMQDNDPIVYAIPPAQELWNNIFIAIVCATAGWFTTKVLSLFWSYVFVPLLRKIKSLIL